MSRCRHARSSHMVTFLPLLLLVLGSLPSKSRAATFTIADGDVAALKTAITTANGNDEADVINLAAGGNYVLLEVDNETNGSNALPAITDDLADEDLVLNGNGATLRRASVANTPNFRLLYLASGAELTINGLVLRNGSGDGGGGIRNAGGTLNIRNSTFSQNVALAGDGGGILNGGTLSIDSSTFSQNAISTFFLPMVSAAAFTIMAAL